MIALDTVQLNIWFEYLLPKRQRNWLYVNVFLHKISTSVYFIFHIASKFCAISAVWIKLNYVTTID
jgi:hypothetical protein